MKVGARELKNRWGHYLGYVRSGETVHVMDRGRIVAEIKPAAPAGSAEQEVLRTLASEGVITTGGGRHEDIEPARVRRPRKLTSRMIIDDRR